MAGFGEVRPRDTFATEHGHRFDIDWEKGQKTGFFLDQRENRALLGSLSKEKKVLNVFSYTGGFSIYAMKAGATGSPQFGQFATGP